MVNLKQQSVRGKNNKRLSEVIYVTEQQKDFHIPINMTFQRNYLFNHN